jgi:hypothetical protein
MQTTLFRGVGVAKQLGAQATRIVGAIRPLPASWSLCLAVSSRLPSRTELQRRLVDVNDNAG